MKNKLNKSIFLLLFYIFIINTAFAAEFILNTDTDLIRIKDELKVDLSINTEGENTNAFSGRIIFHKDLLSIKEIRDGNSIINFWIDKPNNTENGIVFSGIIPGGYTGNNGQLLSIVFTSNIEGSGIISIQDEKVLRNDGTGSQVNLKTTNLNFTISGQSSDGQIKISDINDIYPPETFNPEISKDQNLSNNKWFIVFSAEDKGSGIDRYEIKESRYQIFSYSKWIPATSPYVLTDQNLKSFVYVKAVDRSGNIRIIKVRPKNPISWYENIENWIIIISLLGILYFYLKRNGYWQKTLI